MNSFFLLLVSVAGFYSNANALPEVSNRLASDRLVQKIQLQHGPFSSVAPSEHYLLPVLDTVTMISDQKMK